MLLTGVGLSHLCGIITVFPLHTAPFYVIEEGLKALRLARRALPHVTSTLCAPPELSLLSSNQN